MFWIFNWVLIILILVWLSRKHRIRRYFRELRDRFCSQVWSAPFFWIGQRWRFIREVSPNANKAETAAIIWFQRRYGWSSMSDYGAVAFLAIYLFLGVGLLVLLAAGILGIFAIHMPAIHAIAGVMMLAVAAFFLLLWINARRFMEQKLYRTSFIRIFSSVPQYSVVDTIYFVILGLTPTVFILSLALPAFPMLISAHPSPVWFVIFSLLCCWLFAWWSQFAIWFFAHPRHGILRVRCHVPLLMAVSCSSRSAHPK